MDGYYGIEQDDSTFNGVIGMIARNEIDVGVIDIYSTVSRHKAVDYSVILENLEYVCVYYSFFYL